MSGRATKRAEVLDRLSNALYKDPRLAGAVLVGSGAHGFQDDESDIDLVAPVAAAYDPATVFHEWKEHINKVIAVRYQAETAATQQNHLLVLLCDDRLEIDLSFPPLRALVALTPKWCVLWERTSEVTQRMALPAGANGNTEEQVYLWTVNRAVHRAVYAAKALGRGQGWKALLLLDELRCRAVQLACMDLLGETPSDILGPNGVERHADRLPPEALAQLSRSLPCSSGMEALQQSLRACVDVVLGHAATLDQRYGIERSERLAAVMHPYLDSANAEAETNAA